MTEPKPLTNEELAKIADEIENEGLAIGCDMALRLLATIRERDATIKRRDVLLEHAFIESAREEYHKNNSIHFGWECPICREIHAVLGLPQPD